MKFVVDGKMQTMAEPGADSLAERLRRLEDERAIREILYHYTRAVDTGSMEGIASCYTEDGCFYPSDKSAPIVGKIAILEVFARLMDPTVKSSAHYITNQQIGFLGVDEALVFAYFYANKTFSGGRGDEVTWGGYELRMLRDGDGEWRIKTHKVFFNRQDGSRTGRCGEHLNRPWPPVLERTSRD